MADQTRINRALNKSEGGIEEEKNRAWMVKEGLKKKRATLGCIVLPSLSLDGRRLYIADASRIVRSSRRSKQNIHTTATTDFKDSIATEHPVATVAPFEIFSGCVSSEPIVPNGFGAVEADLIPSYQGFTLFHPHKRRDALQYGSGTDRRRWRAASPTTLKQRCGWTATARTSEPRTSSAACGGSGGPMRRGGAHQHLQRERMTAKTTPAWTTASFGETATFLTDFKDSIAAEHPVATAAPFEIFSGCGLSEATVPNEFGAVEADLVPPDLGGIGGCRVRISRRERDVLEVGPTVVEEAVVQVKLVLPTLETLVEDTINTLTDMGVRVTAEASQAHEF
ncbi:hypothetical protein Syun_001819 [Stephania yunnanensis]|uniref:Uncharacterized protein n=1 Tax=Stephania yunnanensis TaxID=152371 RepID=A0AAP0LIK5_9MAGN